MRQGQRETTNEKPSKKARTPSPTRIVLGRIFRNRSSALGAFIVVVFMLMALVAPWLTTHDTIAMELSRKFTPPLTGGHLLGTDNFGRDIWSRMVMGSRISLQVGVIAVGLSATTGTVIGLFSGYFGGRLDMVVQRLVEIMMAFPGLLLALAIIAILGPGLRNVMVAVCIGGMPSYVRLVRGQVLSVKEREFVEAEHALGASHSRIVFRHVLPNILSPIIVLASLGIAGAILSAASLSFIGLGAQPPSPEWGAMLATGRAFMRRAWWLSTFPGIAIALTVLGFNLLGDGLRDALDPHQIVSGKNGDN